MRGLRATAAAFPLPAGFQVHLPPLPLPLIREQHHPATLAPTCPWCTAAQMRMTSCAHASSGLEDALSLQGAAGRAAGRSASEEASTHRQYIDTRWRMR